MKKILTITTLLMFTLPLSARVTCKSLSSCAEACQYLAEGHRGLDRDRDGIPCEKLCFSPCKTHKAKKPKKKKK